MTYRIGDTIIHPQHGPARIVAKPKRDFGGKSVTYLELETTVAETSARLNPAMRILVVEATADDTGLRAPATPTDADDILVTLAATTTRVPANWSRRYKNHTNMLASGDLFQVAAVVRNLTVRNRSTPLAPAERRMLTKAEHLLAAELAIPWEVDVDDALARIRAAITGASTADTPAPSP